jgi:hypothetical protein
MKSRNILIVLSGLIMVVNIFMIDFDKLLDFEMNSQPYLGFIAMSLLTISLILSKKRKQEPQ